MNKLLRRQIEEHLGPAESVPRELQPLLDAVSEAYDSRDTDRKLVKQSLEVSSTELITINTRLRQEICDRQKIEEKLQHAVSLLIATLEATADGILVVDRQRRIEDYNKKFKTLWKIPEAVLETKDDEQVSAVAAQQLRDPEAFLSQMRQLYDQPTSKSFDILYFKDGRIFERCSKPQSIGDDIVGRVWSFRDVTERVEADLEQIHLLAELENTNRELAKVNQELNHFAYVVSHDLKAPLRGVKMLAEWISADHAEQLTDEGKEQFDLLLGRVDRMHALIDGILQYSRIGRVEDDIVALDLNGFLPSVIDILAPPQNITVTVQDNLPVIQAERTRILQVFQNLLSNAIKYMDKPQGKIHVGCTEEEGLWQFSVADNGPGIEAQYAERVFQLFQTLSPRDKFESTGVGLSLVKRIVEMYGGRVWLESEPGNGCTFLFTLPNTKGEIVDAQLQASTTC